MLGCALLALPLCHKSHNSTLQRFLQSGAIGIVRRFRKEGGGGAVPAGTQPRVVLANTQSYPPHLFHTPVVAVVLRQVLQDVPARGRSTARAAAASLLFEGMEGIGNAPAQRRVAHSTNTTPHATRTAADGRKRSLVATSHGCAGSALFRDDWRLMRSITIWGPHLCHYRQAPRNARPLTPHKMDVHHKPPLAGAAASCVQTPGTSTSSVEVPDMRDLGVCGSTASDAPAADTPAPARTVTIAVEGCCHGELDDIYASIADLKESRGVVVELLIICGDFQACRNAADLSCLACPPKYRHMVQCGTQHATAVTVQLTRWCACVRCGAWQRGFYEYYSGKKVAPVLTVFVGGNHEASNHLQVRCGSVRRHVPC